MNKVTLEALWDAARDTREGAREAREGAREARVNSERIQGRSKALRSKLSRIPGATSAERHPTNGAQASE